MTKSSNKPSMSFFTQKPRGLLRFGLRFPIWLYHLHLGWLLGNRFLLLTHTGRKSGLPRESVIEIIRYDKASGVCVVASGWGTRSDWFLNLQQTPEATVIVGLRNLKTQAVFLSELDGGRELFDYAKNHPIAFREITAMFTGSCIAGTEENCHELAKVIPIVVFQPGNNGETYEISARH